MRQEGLGQAVRQRQDDVLPGQRDRRQEMQQRVGDRKMGTVAVAGAVLATIGFGMPRVGRDACLHGHRRPGCHGCLALGVARCRRPQGLGGSRRMLFHSARGGLRTLEDQAQGQQYPEQDGTDRHGGVILQGRCERAEATLKESLCSLGRERGNRWRGQPIAQMNPASQGWTRGARGWKPALGRGGLPGCTQGRESSDNGRCVRCDIVDHY